MLATLTVMIVKCGGRVGGDVPRPLLTHTLVRTRILFSVHRESETAGPSTSVGMTILWYPQQVDRDTPQPSDGIVIPTEVEGPAVSLPRSWVLAELGNI